MLHPIRPRERLGAPIGSPVPRGRRRGDSAGSQYRPGPRPSSAPAQGARGANLRRAVKTYVATPADRQRDWLLVDADGKTLGRMATQIAETLRGKRKPEYTPHCDVGDFVIVVNAEKVSVTGDKRQAKRYYRHSGYPGGLRSRTLAEMLERRPEEVIRLAVKGMLPRTRLGRAQLRKLKVYAGPDHPHAAQKPQPMEVEVA
ncbi:MAG: 50S ribosomal protein L13 [Actinobacteria bacterium]|nr:50S ribosomal protein L13 [Actinomycetota bacterium]